MEAYMIDPDLGTITEAIPNRSEVLSPAGRWSGGTEKIPEEWLGYWPSRAAADPKFDTPTAWATASGYCVSSGVKDVIENLAPDVHQFIPLTLEAGPKGRRKDYTYYSIHVADRADEVDLEKSVVNWRQRTGGAVGKYWTKRVDTPIVLPARSITGKHLWWNRRCNILLMSGELHDRLVERVLASGLKFQKQIVE